MEPRETLLARLAGLLADNGIGLTMLTPRPRGRGLGDDSRGQLKRVLAELEASSPAPADLVYGNGCFAVGRYVDATAVYRRILEMHPDDSAAGFNLGLALLRERRHREGVDELTSLLAREPRLAEAHYQRGNGYDDLGDHELALGDYARAIELNPDYLQAFYNRGVVLARLGRHQEAVGEFDRVVVLNPEISNAYLNRGASRDELGLHAEAVGDYNEALRCNPDNADALFNRARTNYHLGNIEETIADYSEVIRLTPGDAEALNNRGLAFDALEEYSTALEDYSQAMALRPDFSEALSNRGAALEALGKLQEALEDYLAALAVEPTFAAAHFNAARLYTKQRDLDRCLPHLDEAIRLSPEMREDAAQDEHLGWVLRLRELKQRGDNYSENREDPG